MSSTYAEVIRSALADDDSPELVRILEPRVRDGQATSEETLLCGVTLLMPPLADYDAASVMFASLFASRRRWEAAVWDAYRFVVLQPNGNEEFAEVLTDRRQSAVGAHLLSELADRRGDRRFAIEENRRSIVMRPFPANLLRALTIDPDLDAQQRRYMWEVALDLMVRRDVEKSQRRATTVEGALQEYWDNLITLTAVTTALFEHYASKFGRVEATPELT